MKSLNVLLLLLIFTLPLQAENLTDGIDAGDNLTTGDRNILFGYRAGRDLKTGNGNIFLGFQAGMRGTDRNYGIYLGYMAGYNDSTDNRLYISNRPKSGSDSDFKGIWGDLTNGFFGFNTESTRGLEVNGAFGADSLEVAGVNITSSGIALTASYGVITTFEIQGTTAGTDSLFQVKSSLGNLVASIDTLGTASFANSITTGSDGLNQAGTVTGIATDGDTSNITWNTSDQIEMAGNNGAGVLIGTDYAGLYTDSHAGAITIALVEAFQKIVAFNADQEESISDAAHATDDITIGATGVYDVSFSGYGSTAGTNKSYEFFGFEIAAGTSVVGFITTADPAVVSSEVHGFNDGDRVKFSGVGGMVEVNDHMYTVASATDSTFTLDTDDGTDVNSGGYTPWSSAGVMQLATILLSVHAERKFAVNGDLGSFAGTPTYVSLTGANTVELWLKGITDATDFDFDGGNIGIRRVK